MEDATAPAGREEAARLVRRAQETLARPAGGDGAERTETAIRLYDAALRLLEPGDARARGTVLFNLGVCMRERRDGPRDQHLERAIAYHRSALTEQDRERYPQEWARTQNALGVTWHERLRGDPQENRRRAAAALQLALEVRDGDDRAITLCNLANVHAHGNGEQRAAHVEAALRCYREALDLLHPDNAETRAAVLFNLATVLVDASPGDRGENIEAAIDAVQEALALGLPERDALAAKLVLANALGQRLTGSRADSLERALALVEEVVAGRDPRADPYRWANAHNSRGILFSRRLLGGRADNIEEAVASFRNALGVYRPELYARDRAGALNNLATVLRARPLGNREANETEAIGALHEALEVYDRATDPYSWAGTMLNLGTAHFERRTGDPHDNVGAAIDAYEQALEVRTEAALPWEWAATMFNLGQAYWRRYRGDRTASLDLAARSLRAAMRVRTPTAAPEEWAGAQSMLALVLDERSQLDRPELLEDALRAYEAAATVYEPEAFPYEARANANNLAGTLLRVGRYEDAWRRASTGLRAAELLYDAAPTEEGREVELDDNARLYRIAAEAALLAGRPAGDVFEIAERGRGRLLRDWLAASSLPAPGAVDAGLIDREQRSLEDLRAAILVARSAGVGGDRARSVARAASARAALERVWAQIESQPGGAPYVAERRGSRLRAAELQDWLDAQPGRPAIIVLSSLRDHPIAFVGVRGGAGLEVVRCDTTDAEVGALLAQLHEQLVSPQRAEEAACNSTPASEAWTRIGDLLIAPALSRIGDVSLLYIVPIGALHAVPWHACSIDGEALVTRVATVLAPSAAMATRMARSESPLPRPGRGTLVVGDPRGDLRHAAREAHSVARRVAARPLIGAQASVDATLAQLRLTQWAHFAAHATYDPGDPLESGIELADGMLTARMLLNGRSPAVVVVSACESGRQRAAAGDELWGLGRALLYAGARTTVLSLWPVDDDAAERFMGRLYDQLMSAGGATDRPRLADAMRHAMLETRRHESRTARWAPFALIGSPW